MKLGQQEAGAQVLFTIRDCMIGEAGQAGVQNSFGRKVVRINEDCFENCVKFLMVL